MLTFFKENMRNAPLDLLRAFLGIALIGKGLFFVFHLHDLQLLVEQSLSYSNFLLSHYIVLAHLAGGLCISIGLFTRFASIINLPILLGAVFFVHFSNEVFTAAKPISSGLEVSVMVLFSLAIFSIYGSGKLSADHYLASQNPEKDEEELINKRIEQDHNKKAS